MSNTIDWGKIHYSSWSPETNLTGTATGFSNTQSTSYSIDEYIDCGDNDNLSFGNGTTDSPFSISAWVNIRTIANFIIVSKDSSSNREYAFRIVSNNIRVFLLDNSSGGYIGRYYNSDLTSIEDTWNHFSFTYNGNSTSSGIKIYLNGSRVDDNNYQGGSYTSMENTLSNLNIGKQEITNLFSNGNIDEVSVFNSELSASDITSIYNSGIPNDISSLSPLSWWRFEGTGLTATDSGSGGNDGTLENGVIRSTDVPT